MSSVTENLLAMLLSSGGGTEPTSIQALIDNGKYLDTITINSKYRLDLYAINYTICRPPLHGLNGFDFTSANEFRSFNEMPIPDVIGTDSDGTVRAGFFGKRIYFCFYYIAYEDDEPILAARIGNYTGSEQISAYHSKDTSPYIIKALPEQMYYYDIDTFTMNTTNFTLYNQYLTTWLGHVYDADTEQYASGTATRYRYVYGYWRDSEGELHAKLDEVQQETSTLYLTEGLTSTIYANSYNETCEKWFGLYQAVNKIYYNVDVVDLVLEQPFDPPT